MRHVRGSRGRLPHTSLESRLHPKPGRTAAQIRRDGQNDRGVCLLASCFCLRTTKFSSGAGWKEVMPRKAVLPAPSACMVIVAQGGRLGYPQQEESRGGLPVC